MKISVKHIVGNRFLVNILGEFGCKNYKVNLTDDYWKIITNSEIKREDLIIKSFKFLLKREKIELIMQDFDIEIITKYFPEYEKEIKS